jgi:cytochrome c oxidase subunit 3
MAEMSASSRHGNVGTAEAHSSADVQGLRHHFEDMEQQQEAGNLGMWVFLVTEILFFGGLFAAYAIYRSLYFPGFEAGSRLLDVKLGATNTAVLLGSSLTMALAVRAAQMGKRKALIIFLLLTMALGAVFLGIKFDEYAQKWHHHLVPGLRFDPDEPIPGNAPLGSVEMFFLFYFFMTGLHALHMIIGFGIMTAVTIQAWRRKFSPGYYAPVEVSGLYWHFVDIIWIFLFPLLYLIGGRY